MKLAKPAITALMDTLVGEVTLANMKEIEDTISKLKNICLGDELIQPALLNTKKNESGEICCPYCGSTHVKKNGHNRQHKQVYQCLENSCKCKNFTATTNTILFSTKKEVGTWITFMKAYLDQDTLTVCADKAGISEDTAFFLRHKINYFINKSMNKSVLRDEIELDETVITDCNIGKESIKQKTKKRGMSNDKVNIATAIDSHQNIIIKASVNGKITSVALLEVYTGLIEEGSTVKSDSLRSYHKFMKEMKVNWVKIPSGEKEKRWTYMGI